MTRWAGEPLEQHFELETGAEEYLLSTHLCIMAMAEGNRGQAVVMTVQFGHTLQAVGPIAFLVATENLK